MNLEMEQLKQYVKERKSTIVKEMEFRLLRTKDSLGDELRLLTAAVNELDCILLKIEQVQREQK